MIFLLLSILFSTTINVVLRLFKKWEVDTFQSIVFNYWTCSIVGAIIFIFSKSEDLLANHTEWLPYSLFLGLVFIVGFNIAAATIRYFGITLATIMQKLSLVISVVVAIVFFAESSAFLKIFGIALSIPAIVLINLKSDVHHAHFGRKHIGWILILLPILTFLINGIIETSFYYVKKTGIVLNQDLVFVSLIFFMAALLGSSILAIGIMRGKMTLKLKNVKAGFILGVPNFASIFFLVKALSGYMEGSVVIPFNNIAIVILSAMIGLITFKERFKLIHYIGFSLAVLSIILISLS